MFKIQVLNKEGWTDLVDVNDYFVSEPMRFRTSKEAWDWFVSRCQAGEPDDNWMILSTRCVTL